MKENKVSKKLMLLWFVHGWFCACILYFGFHHEHRTYLFVCLIFECITLFMTKYLHQRNS